MEVPRSVRLHSCPGRVSDLVKELENLAGNCSHLERLYRDWLGLLRDFRNFNSPGDSIVQPKLRKVVLEEEKLERKEKKALYFSTILRVLWVK
jgi:hypothetical protein